MIRIIAFLVALFATFPAFANQPEAPQCKWDDAFSGRFYLEPRSAFLDAGLTPLIYQQVQWWFEIEVKLRDGQPSDKVCSTPAANRPEGSGTCVNDPVGPLRVLSTNITRKFVLDTLIKLKTLPKEKGRSLAFPRELYSDRLWEQLVRQSLDYQWGKNVEFCRARLVVRRLRHKSALQGDLKWWDEQIIIFPDGGKECCK